MAEGLTGTQDVEKIIAELFRVKVNNVQSSVVFGFD